MSKTVTMDKIVAVEPERRAPLLVGVDVIRVLSGNASAAPPVSPGFKNLLREIFARCPPYTNSG